MMKKMLPLLMLMIFFVAISAVYAEPEKLELLPLEKGHQALSRLYQAAADGELSQADFIRQVGYILFAPERIDPRFQAGPGSALKCGTLLIRELRKNLHLLTEAEQSFFANRLARPANQFFYDTPGGHFRIHYDTSGPHTILEPTNDVDPADGVPDFVNRTAESADNVYLMETTSGPPGSLNYDDPPDDGAEGGGSNLYDLYFQALGAGLYGYCAPDGDGSATYPGRTGCFKSYIALHKDFFWESDRIGAMQVTMTHEFHHAVQFAYNYNADAAFMENCAQNMEDLVYDNLNLYYTWLNPRYRNPHKKLKEFDGAIEYATMIWPMYLTQKYGHNLVRAIWETSITENNTIDAYLATLQTELGKSLVEIYQEFTTWFILSGDWDDGQHFEEGAFWADAINVGGTDHAKIENYHASFPAAGATANLPSSLGCNFIEFNTSAAGGYGLNISFAGNVVDTNKDRWGVTTMAWDDFNKVWTTKSYEAPVSGQIDVDVHDPFQVVTKVILIVQNVRYYGTPANPTFSYSATIKPTAEINVPVLSTWSIVLVLFFFTIVIVIHNRQRRVKVLARV